MLDKLNAAQQAAARYLDGPLLVLAGAGSGKTRVITHKIGYLIQECAYHPRNIAAITFTNKAANEMRERAATLVQHKNLRDLTVSTFHSLGMTILRQEAALLNYKPRFSIFDSSDCQKILAEIINSTDKQQIRDLQTTISGWKAAFLTPEQTLERADNDILQTYARAYLRYQDTLHAYQAVDFDDLIRLPVQLFQQHPQALQRWQHKLRYLLIDEYQDTNDCQYQLTRLLAGSRGAFTAVGDDDQSIYAWRGASIENLHKLQHDYPQLRIIKLEQNYRSSQHILTAANQLIKHNRKVFEKKLWSEHGPGDTLRIYAARDELHEAESTVMKLVSHKLEHKNRYADYAILYRSNHLSRAFEQQLRTQRIPYIVSGGTSFFDRAEIKDITAYLRLIANPDDDPAFIRAITTPRRGLGNQTLETLGTHAGKRHISLFDAAFDLYMQQTLPARQYEELQRFCQFINRLQSRADQTSCGEVLDELLRAIDYEGWLFTNFDSRQAENKQKNVLEFIDWLKRKATLDDKSLVDLVQTINLMNMLDNKDQEADAVTLSTLHAAKGLEFPHVFIIGTEEEILPFRDSDEFQIEEERRLMYVGITRAERSLQISYCNRRKRAGDWQACEPSRFIDELPKDILVYAGQHREAQPTVTKEEGMNKLASLKAMLKSDNASDDQAKN